MPTPATPCESGAQCPQGSVCDAVAGYCVLAAGAGVDGGVQGTERQLVRIDTPSSPGPLWGPKLVYHGQRNTVLLYGGGTNQGGETSPLGAMWEYDGSDWAELCDPCPPGPRFGHGLVYDSDQDRLLLFGGESSQGLHNDTWEWAAGDWSRVTTTGAALSPRGGVMMTYDSGRNRVVLFGGRDRNGDTTDELFEFDGASWVQIEPAEVPEARQEDSSNAVYVAARGQTLIYSGYAAGWGTALDDFWAWDGLVWTRLCEACSGAPHASTSLAFDPALDTFVKFGGYSNVEMSAIAVWSGTLWSTVSTDQLPPRDSMGVASDERRGVIVLYGGNGSSCPGAGSDCEDTYEYQLVD